MGVLTSSLVISLTDLVSGPASGVQASIKKLSSAAADVGRVADTVSAGSKSLFKPLTDLTASNLNETYYAWSQQVAEIAAVSETGEQGMERLRAAVMRVSKDAKVPAQELLAAAQAYLQVGGKLQDVEGILAVAAKTSRMTHSLPSEQLIAANAIIKAYGENPSDPAIVKKYDETLLIASKGMPGGLHAFEEAIRQFAPVAKSMGITFQQAAALVQTLGGQFDAPTVGHALKTGFVRMLSPRSGGLSAMRAAGIDYTQFFKFDVDKMHAQGGIDFSERLRGMSQQVTPELEAEIEKTFAETDISKGVGPLQDKLTKVLTDALGEADRKGVHHLKGQFAKDLPSAIAQAVQQYKQVADGFDIEKFLSVMSQQVGNVPLMDKIFGVNRLPQFLDLLRQGEHYAERLKKLMDEAPGAIDRKWTEFFDKGDNYSRSVDNLTNAFDRLWKGMADNGVGASVATIFNTVAKALDFLGAHPGWAQIAFGASVAFAAIKSLTGIMALLTIGLRGVTALGGMAGIGAALGVGATAAQGAGMVAGMSVAGAAAAGGTAAASAGILGRIAGYAFPGLGIILLGASAAAGGVGAYNDYQKNGDVWSAVKAFFGNALTLGLGGAAKADEAPPSAASTVVAAGRTVAAGQSVPNPQGGPDPQGVSDSGQVAGDGLASGIESGAQRSVAAVEAAFAQIRAIAASVDLAPEGRAMMETLARGIAEGASSVATAARQAADQGVRNAVRSAYSDGGMR